MSLDELEKLCKQEHFSVNDGTGKGLMDSIVMVDLIPGKMQALIACARVLERVVSNAYAWDIDVDEKRWCMNHADKALAALYSDGPKDVPDWQCG